MHSTHSSDSSCSSRPSRTGSPGPSGPAGAAPSRAEKRLPLTVIIGALAVVLLLAAFSVFGGESGESGESGDRSTAGEPSAAGEPADGDDTAEVRETDDAPDERLLALARRDADDPYALGEADAPVVLIEYSDFQCPFCGTFARDTKPELVRRYVDEGVLRIEMRQFPIFGEESESAALASWAAGQQELFWEFHDVAFGEDRPRNSGAYAPDKLEDMAREAGVTDIRRFRADMNSDEALAAVETDVEEGYRLGVSSTPAFLINGTPVLGAQPTDVFADIVEDARPAAGR
ncbi:DsbA family protein [Streptomyces sp. ACA25]|uniref:DsbA family protein n=1 Tax=Streptomyces sp. ACA25 TaxID=3022596 RepID=UPI0023078A1D|nr:DsbA family protein [Streptomyces sp. ACA25]MDB1088675.1 DsbA family protein [Streptomyces sp. ACA25]